MISLRFFIVAAIAAEGLSASAFAQQALTSLRPVGSPSQTEPLFVLPGGRVRSAPAMTGTEAVGPTMFFDDFSTYLPTDYTNVPLSLVPLGGQVNPAGLVWRPSATNPADWFGAATVGIMQAAGASAPIGVSPAFGPITTFAAAARATGQSVYTPDFLLLGSSRLSLAFYAPQTGQPVTFAQDVYLSSADGQPRTNVWWSPLSSEEGIVVDRVFFGGVNTANIFDFAENPQQVLDRFMSAGAYNDCLECGNVVGFFASGRHPNFPFPVNQWFTLMGHMDDTGNGFPLVSYSLWVKTADTVSATPPFIDPRMASGDIVPVDGDPVGWINTYPGFVDDPLTVNVVEGVGIAVDHLGIEALTSGYLGQAPQSFLNTASTLDAVQYGYGLDNPTDPTFLAEDYFFGPLRVAGVIVDPPCPPGSLQEAKIRPNDLASGDLFGSSIALSGDEAIIGSPLRNTPAEKNAGSVYVFHRDTAGSWTQGQTILAPDAAANDSFGVSVAVDGDLLVVGAEDRDETNLNQGAVYIYQRDALGTWLFVQKLLANDPIDNGRLGAGVALAEGLLLISTENNLFTSLNPGSVYVFGLDANGVFNFESKLTLPVGSFAGDHFGVGLDIDGQSFAVGAPSAATTGQVVVYDRLAPGVIVEQATLSPPTVIDSAFFGAGVDLDGDDLLIGAPLINEAFLFKMGAPGSWIERTTFTPFDNASAFGITVDLQPSSAFFGATSGVLPTGAIYTFSNSASGVWTPATLITSCDLAAYDRFEKPFAISAGKLAVGVDVDGGGGSAYVFDVASFTCPSDLTSDNAVDIADLANLLAVWGGSGVQADLNGDGVVDIADLANLLANWGACPL